MRPEALGLRAEADGPLQRLDPRPKIVAALAFVVLVVATPVDAGRLLAAEGLALAFVVGLSGVAPRDLFARWAGFLAVVGVLAAMVARSHPDAPRLGWGAVFLGVLARNSLAFVAVMTLAGTTPMRRLLDGLRRLGVPPTLVATLHFMGRYLSVLGDELARMGQARRSRTFRRSGRLDVVGLSGLVGRLFVRSFERGERVHAAMVARGWDGTIRTLDGPDDRARPR